MEHDVAPQITLETSTKKASMEKEVGRIGKFLTNLGKVNIQEIAEAQSRSVLSMKLGDFSMVNSFYVS